MNRNVQIIRNSTIISVTTLRSKCQALFSKPWAHVVFGLICVDSV